MRGFKPTKNITSKETDSLNKYFTEIDQTDLLTPEQEVELAIRIKQ